MMPVGAPARSKLMSTSGLPVVWAFVIEMVSASSKLVVP